MFRREWITNAEGPGAEEFEIAAQPGLAGGAGHRRVRWRPRISMRTPQRAPGSGTFRRWPRDYFSLRSADAPLDCKVARGGEGVWPTPDDAEHVCAGLVARRADAPRFRLVNMFGAQNTLVMLDQLQRQCLEQLYAPAQRRPPRRSRRRATTIFSNVISRNMADWRGCRRLGRPSTSVNSSTCDR